MNKIKMCSSYPNLVWRFSISLLRIALECGPDFLILNCFYKEFYQNENCPRDSVVNSKHVFTSPNSNMLKINIGIKEHQISIQIYLDWTRNGLGSELFFLYLNVGVCVVIVSIYLSICLSVCLSVCLSIYLSI